jgi:hypothetical protein
MTALCLALVGCAVIACVRAAIVLAHVQADTRLTRRWLQTWIAHWPDPTVKQDLEAVAREEQER